MEEAKRPQLLDEIAILGCIMCGGKVDASMVMYLRIREHVIERQEGVCQQCHKEAVVTLKSQNCPYLVSISTADDSISKP